MAVVGASRHRGKVGYSLIRNLVVNEFQGSLFPVNPKAHSVHGIKAYPSVTAIPHDVDLAVIAVPAALVLETVEECGRKGVKGLVVITAGFSETGAKGIELEKQLLEVVRRHGMAMVGPNCMGVINTAEDVSLDATFAPTPPLRGNISFMSQSGALGVAILDHARDINVGFAKFVSLGNKADVSGNDLLRSWEDDPATKLILMYIESFGNPRNFVRIAKSVVKKKPLLVLKSGRTEQGARAAVSHTGALGGSDVAADAIFEQTGTLRVQSIEDLFDAAMAFSLQELPRGKRVAVVTDAGGPAIMCTDELIGLGLEMATLSEKTMEELRKVCPPEASVHNPVDLIADADAERYAKALEIVLADKAVDAAIVIYVPPVVAGEVAVAHAIWTAAKKRKKPVLCNFLGRSAESPGFVELVTHNIPSYLFPESAAKAMAAMVRYREYRDRAEGEFRKFNVPADAGRPLSGKAPGSRLREQESLDLFASYGFDVVKSRAVKDIDGAVAAAAEIGYPIVLKAIAPSLVHKTEAKAIVLDIRDESGLWGEFAKLQRTLEKAGVAVDGYLVQEFLRGGKETILGMKMDRKFGPMLMFGLGGIYVEFLKDVSWAVAPITDLDAGRMVRSIRSFPLLQGVRGEKPADIAAIEEALLRLSQLVEENPKIQEIDINPFLVGEKGKGGKVVDARVIL